MHELVHLLLALLCEHPLVDLQSLGAQGPDPAAANRRVGVGDTDDDVTHTGPEQRFGARRRPAEVIAGLEGDVGCSPLGRHPTNLGVGYGHLLGVQSSDVVVPALGDDFVVSHEHASDQRIGHDAPSSTLGQLERASHETGFSVHVIPDSGTASHSSFLVLRVFKS